VTKPLDLAELPFDADAMLDGLRLWVECESPTWDVAAVNRMMDLASQALVGARIERIPGRMGFGDCLRATVPHLSPALPGILVLGHLDTVHPVGTLGRLPFRRDRGRAWGPGICDMKGGLYVTLEAIGVLARAGHSTPLPITLLLTGDEEAGSPTSRELIEAETARHRYVLVPEPAPPDGGVVTGRCAIARFNLEATGRPGHAGARLAEGRSAIREMARKILDIEVMSTEACSFNVGVVRGGQWVNCVPDRCTAEVLVMGRRQKDLEGGVARMVSLSASGSDVRFTATKGATRPAWAPNAGTMALYEVARGVARSLGHDLSQQQAAGGSDGNFAGALGVPTLDGLGVEGAGGHTLDEHIMVDSLAQRGRLMAGLLVALT
jgi:glutamate carboxypeptidase